MSSAGSNMARPIIVVCTAGSPPLATISAKATPPIPDGPARAHALAMTMGCGRARLHDRRSFVVGEAVAPPVTLLLSARMTWLLAQRSTSG